MLNDKGKPSQGICYAKELKEMPDYSNASTRATEVRLGPFLFDREAMQQSPDIIDRGPYELNNGAVYHGQWTQDGRREGRGTQIWPDGSKFTGMWKNDQGNGRGRLIHSDGDVYEGDWKDDKA